MGILGEADRANDGQSGADVLLCTFESNNVGFPSFPVRENSFLRVILIPLQHVFINETLQTSCGEQIKVNKTR
jgi:hypothetical protein